MNNDGLIDEDDDDVFTLALTDPSGYTESYPGLEGSRVYHGDCNCSGTFNSSDQTAFDARLADQCCTTDCYQYGCPAPPPGGP